MAALRLLAGIFLFPGTAVLSSLNIAIDDDGDIVGEGPVGFDISEVEPLDPPVRLPLSILRTLRTEAGDGDSGFGEFGIDG